MPQVDEINATLAAVNPLIFGDNPRLSLRYVLFSDVKEQDINANVMPIGMFNALKGNVEKHKALESVPLCATRVETPGLIEVVSGHHRMRAGRQAGMDGCVVLLYSGLTDAEIKAKQLAHNAIAGTSDPAIVKEIFSQINNIEMKMESYIDPQIFSNLPSSMTFEPIEVDPLADAKTVTVVFLPTQATDFHTAVELLSSNPDAVYLANREAFDGFKEAVQQIRAELEIVSYPTALAAMARLAIERLAQKKEEWRVAETEAVARGEDPPGHAVESAELDPDLLLAFGRE